MRELKKLEETTINKRIFVEIEICVREGKVMTTTKRLSLISLSTEAGNRNRITHM